MNKVILIIIAILITLAAAIYQKKTGPTYPLNKVIRVGVSNIEMTLPRSHSGNTHCPLTIYVPDKEISAKVLYKPFPSNDKFTEFNFERKHDSLFALLPPQPPAGKLAYFLEFSKNGHIVAKLENLEPVIIRFKGEVPNIYLIPHIIFIFFAMLFANISGLFAIAKIPSYKLYSYITLGLFLLGGMVFGPIVQKFAFGEYWAGIPYGWDLTDNKMLFAFILWIIAVIGNIKKDRRSWIVIASIFIIIIFSIPHSTYGSELNRETGKVIQG